MPLPFDAFSNLHTMITIRSSNNVSGPTLLSLEASLTTPHAAYEFSSNSPLVESSPSLGGVFGAISWLHSRFQLGPDLILEQQILLPEESADAAISWELRGKLIPARLIVQPHFGGCGPRSYRDVGFKQDAQEDGARLSWLPDVRGPKIFADTNGRYHDEPPRSLETLATSSKFVVAPGTFEFELSERPSVLIFSADRYPQTQRDQHIRTFLAGLTRSDVCSKPAVFGLPKPELASRAELVAA